MQSYSNNLRKHNIKLCDLYKLDLQVKQVNKQATAKMHNRCNAGNSASSCCSGLKCMFQVMCIKTMFTTVKAM
jgi:hypothetical protein